MWNFGIYHTQQINTKPIKYIWCLQTYSQFSLCEQCVSCPLPILKCPASILCICVRVHGVLIKITSRFLFGQVYE